MYVENCYTKPSRLFVIDGVEISSSEGTTQGETIAMAVSDVLEFLQDVILLVDVYSPIIKRVEGSIYTKNARPVYTQMLTLRHIVYTDIHTP